MARNPWSSLRHTPRGTRGVLLAAVCGVLAAGSTISAQAAVPRSTLLRGEAHVWELQEIALRSAASYANPYAEVVVWIDLEGPGFSRRVHGFWDGERTFKVRFVATAPGEWRWRTGSNQPGDAGLNGGRGQLRAVPWTEDERQQNPNRRGFVRAAANGHALAYADGTPFFLLGDTWLAASTWRLPFRGVPARAEVPGPGLSFEDAVAFRKGQGFNSVSLISAFPNWDADEHGATFANADGVFLRNAWEKFGHWAPNAAVTTEDGATTTAKDMADELGNRPFVVLADRDGLADFDRLNPAYFRSLDRKLRHLSEQGFVPLLETVRRDSCPSWKAYFDFDVSYSRYVQYLIARYGAFNLLFSGIHLDWIPKEYSLTAEEFNKALSHHWRTYGPLPFGQPYTTLIDSSTYKRFGHGDKAPWLTMHTVGNKPRNNAIYASIEELFRLDPPYPAANLEPYYAGLEPRDQPPGRRDTGPGRRARWLLRALDDVRVGAVGRARGPRLRHRRLRPHEHGRAARLATLRLGGPPLSVRCADAAPRELRALRRRRVPGAGARLDRPRAAQRSRRVGRRPRRLGVPGAQRRPAARPALLRAGRGPDRRQRPAARRRLRVALVRPTRGPLAVAAAAAHRRIGRAARAGFPRWRHDRRTGLGRQAEARRQLTRAPRGVRCDNPTMTVAQEDRVLLAWSSGKDAAYSLHVLRARGVEVVGLLTTINAPTERVAMHDVRRELVRRQAEAVGLPLVEVGLPWPCPNEAYEAAMATALAGARARGATAVAFGDLFLEDVRRYREERMAGTGLGTMFPLWGRPTRELAEEMLAAGQKAVLTTVDLRVLPPDARGSRLRREPDPPPAGERRPLRRERRVPHLRVGRTRVPASRAGRGRDRRRARRVRLRRPAPRHVAVEQSGCGIQARKTEGW